MFVHNRRSPPLLVALAIALTLLASCVTQYPVREMKPDERPSPATDEASLWRIVERNEYTVRTSGAVIQDPELQEYLESVLCITVPEYCQDIRIYVVPGYGLDATMSPNGMMIVDTGLLLRLENEAQLAAILGHEAAHYVKRHSLSQLQATRSHVNRVGTVDTIIETGVDMSDMAIGGGGGFGLQGMLLAGAIRGGVSTLRTSVRAINNAGLHNYSMEQEAQADATSLSWVADAGYDPEQSVAIWNLVQSEQEADPHSTASPGKGHADGGDVRYTSGGSFVIFAHTSSKNKKGTNAPQQSSPLYAHRDHSARSPEEISISESPENMDRRVNTVKMTASNLRRAHPDAHRVGQAEYMRRVEPFRHDWLLQARGGLPTELETLLIERQRQIGASPGLVLFHEAQMLRQRGGEGDGALAAETFRKALAAEGHPPETHRELGFALWNLGETEQAHQAFDLYLANHPGAPDVAMIRHHVDELAH